MWFKIREKEKHNGNFEGIKNIEKRIASTWRSPRRTPGTTQRNIQKSIELENAKSLSHTGVLVLKITSIQHTLVLELSKSLEETSMPKCVIHYIRLKLPWSRKTPKRNNPRKYTPIKCLLMIWKYELHILVRSIIRLYSMEEQKGFQSETRWTGNLQ